MAEDIRVCGSREGLAYRRVVHIMRRGAQAYDRADEGGTVLLGCGVSSDYDLWKNFLSIAWHCFAVLYYQYIILVVTLSINTLTPSLRRNLVKPVTDYQLPIRRPSGVVGTSHITIN